MNGSGRTYEEGSAAGRPAALPQLPEAWLGAAVAVVLPTYNEASTIGPMLRSLAGLPLRNLSVIVVDDNSPDGTAKIAEDVGGQVARSGFETTVLCRSGKQGLGTAYVAGMTEALGRGVDLVVQMDSDGSHPTDYIVQMLGVLLSTDAGVVIGSRYVPGGSTAEDWSLYRKLLSAWANHYVNLILGLRIRDTTAGYKLWRREVLERIDLDRLRSQGYSFQVEMNYLCTRLGYKVIEVPIHFPDRSAGSSKMDLGVKVESAWVPISLRWRHRTSGPSRT